MSKHTNISSILLAGSTLALAACNGIDTPSLTCDLSHPGPRVSPDAPALQVERRIEATLSNPSEAGVWTFKGTIAEAHSNNGRSTISGTFFQYNNEKFDLMASTEQERITVMPDNQILTERGLQGVTMPIQGGHVSTGKPLSASCQTSLPSVGNQRHEVPEKQ